MNDITGQKFGLLTVIQYIEPAKSRGKNRWKCKCDCGKESIVQDNHLTSGRTKSCGCLHKRKGKDSPFFKGFEELPMDYFSQVRRNSEKRKKEFSITIEDAWNQFIKQNKKCALTGIELSFNGTVKDNKNSITSKRNASLDRINSSKGYIKENIQWIHKDVNIMKNDLDEKDFFYYCKLINENRFNTN